MRFDRRISRRSFLAAGVSAAALALTACGGSSSTAASTAASTGASSAAGTAAGGTLNIMLETEVQSLDPQIATDGTSFEVIADYTDGLMQMDADGAAVPALAETYDISEDGKTYTFPLRDAKWSTGDAVTAADFVFGWQRAVAPANASEYSYMLSDIGQVVNAAELIAGEKPVTDLGVTAVDDKTLEVQLNVPVSYFLSLMYFPTFYPVNEAFFNTCKDTFGTSPDTVLSNGAFIMPDYQPAATAIELTKNPANYNPYTNPENLIHSRNFIMYNMWQQGIISEEDYRNGAAQPLVLAEEDTNKKTSSVTSYFADALFIVVVFVFLVLEGVYDSPAHFILHRCPLHRGGPRHHGQGGRGRIHGPVHALHRRLYHRGHRQPQDADGHGEPDAQRGRRLLPGRLA